MTTKELEKEVKRWLKSHGIMGMSNVWVSFALYFYNLGKGEPRKDCQKYAVLEDRIKEQ